MTIIFKKSSTNENEVDHDIKCNNLECDNLTINGTYTPGPTSNIMTTNTIQSVTAQKNYNADINLNDGKALKINNINVVERDSLNIHNTSFSKAWQFKYETDDRLSFEYVTSGEDRKMVLDGSGLLGITDDNTFLPTASLHVKKSGSSQLTLESVNNNSQISLNPNGSFSSILDFSKNSFQELQSTNYLDLKYGGSHYFRADGLNKNFAMGLNTSPISRCILNIDNANGDVLKLPTLTDAQESTLPNTNSFIYYNTDKNELVSVINGTKQIFHHKGTTDITASQILDVSGDLESGTLQNKIINSDNNTISNISDTNIKTGANININKLGTGLISNTEFNYLSGITSSVVSLNNTQTLTNKTVDKLQMQTISPPTHNEGIIFYDQNEKTLAYYNDKSGIKNEIGRDINIRVYNNSGAQINKFTPVYVSGIEGVENRMTIAPARANTLNTSKCIGVTFEDIPNNSFGYCLSYGTISNVDTSLFPQGSILYLSESIAGNFQTTVVSSNNYNIQLGYVIQSGVSGKALIQLNTDLYSLSGAAEELIIRARKSTPGNINPGEVCFLNGYNNGQNIIEIELADNLTNTPSFGICLSTISNNTTGLVLTHGNLEGILNTSSYSVGDPLYLSNISGQLTNIRPTNENAKIQVVAIVTRSNVNGNIEVTGSARANDLPNLGQNKIFIGNANNQPVSTLNNSVNMTLTDNQIITGYKNFQHNGTDKLDLLTLENISTSSGLNRGAGILLKGTTSSNILNQWSIYAEGNLNKTLCFYDYDLFPGSSGVIMCINNTGTLNFPNGGKIQIAGVDKLTANALDASITSAPGLQIPTQNSLTVTNNINTVSGVYQIGGVDKLTANALDISITSAPGLQIPTQNSLTVTNNINTVSGVYQIGGNNALTNSLLRLNNKDIINETTASLTANIITANLRENISSNNLLQLTDTSLRVENADGIDPYVAFVRNTSEHYKILMTTSGLQFRNDTGGAIPGENQLLLNSTGLDLQQSSDIYMIGGTKVVQSRETGYVSMTGTANKGTSYATSTITLQQLAERVKAIQDSLTTHGLIGV